MADVTPQNEATDMDTPEQIDGFTKVNSRNRSSHHERSSMTGQERAGRVGGPTRQPEPESLMFTYIMFIAVGGFPHAMIEPFIKAFRSHLGGRATEVHAPRKHLGAMFREPKSLLGLAKSFAFRRTYVFLMTMTRGKFIKTNAISDKLERETKGLLYSNSNYIYLTTLPTSPIEFSLYF